MKFCKELGVKVINFEDLGSGAMHANAVINDLYDKKNDYNNHFWGSKYYCIRDEFLLSSPVEFREEVKDLGRRNKKNSRRIPSEMGHRNRISSKKTFISSKLPISLSPSSTTHLVFHFL